MGNKKIVVGLLTASLLFGLAAQSLAMGGKPSKPSHGSKLEHISKQLNLTDEQKAAVQAKSEKTEKEAKESRAKIKEAAEKLKEEMQKDEPNREKVHAYLGQMSQLRNEMQIKRIDALLDLREILTPKQKEEFNKMLGEKKEHKPKDRSSDGIKSKDRRPR